MRLSSIEEPRPPCRAFPFFRIISNGCRKLKTPVPKRHFRSLIFLFPGKWRDQVIVLQARPYHSAAIHEHEYVLRLAVVPLELEFAPDSG